MSGFRDVFAYFMGWFSSAPETPTKPALEYTAPGTQLHYKVSGSQLHYTASGDRYYWTARESDRP